VPHVHSNRGLATPLLIRPTVISSNLHRSTLVVLLRYRHCQTVVSESGSITLRKNGNTFNCGEDRDYGY